MKQKIKYYLSLLAIPLTMLALYLILILIWTAFSLPSPEALTQISKDFLNQHGLPILFLAALIEGILLIGQYVPGGLIIFLGVIAAIPSIPKAIIAVLIVSAGFSISYTLSYLLGKYGLHKIFSKFGLKKALNKAKRNYEKYEHKAILFGYWDPNLASITATAAGILKMPLKDFLKYSTISILLWNTFWGTTVFLMGENALQIMFSPKYGILIFLAWISIILITNYIENKNNP